MKRSLLTLGTLIILGSSSAIAETVKILVPDMECAECAGAIRARLTQEKGIDKVDLDMKTRIVTITTADKTITDAKFKDLVTDAGFTADKIEHL